MVFGRRARDRVETIPLWTIATARTYIDILCEVPLSLADTTEKTFGPEALSKLKANVANL